MKTNHVTDILINFLYSLKTGTSVEDGDPILKLLQGVSRPEIQLHFVTLDYSVSFHQN